MRCDKRGEKFRSGGETEKMREKKGSIIDSLSLRNSMLSNRRVKYLGSAVADITSFTSLLKIFLHKLYRSESRWSRTHTAHNNNNITISRARTYIASPPSLNVFYILHTATYFSKLRNNLTNEEYRARKKWFC